MSAEEVTAQALDHAAAELETPSIPVAANDDAVAEQQAEGGAAEETPEKFSPNVTLRAVVQDYLLPTIAYYGGAAEIAYFAQTAEVYRLLGRPATPICVAMRPIPKRRSFVSRNVSSIVKRFP